MQVSEHFLEIAIFSAGVLLAHIIFIFLASNLEKASFRSGLQLLLRWQRICWAFFPSCLLRSLSSSVRFIFFPLLSKAILLLCATISNFQLYFIPVFASDIFLRCSGLKYRCFNFSPAFFLLSDGKSKYPPPEIFRRSQPRSLKKAIQVLSLSSHSPKPLSKISSNGTIFNLDNFLIQMETGKLVSRLIALLMCVRRRFEGCLVNPTYRTSLFIGSLRA